MKDVWKVLVERLKSPIIINLSTRQRPKKSGVAVTVHSDSHTALGRIAPRHLRHVLVMGVNMP